MLALLPIALKVLPALIGLIEQIVQSAHESRLLAAGQAEAIADALSKAQAQVALARQAEAEAEACHAKNPSDSAFDSDFKRKD